MAPEQVEGAINKQSDQYALGVVLYEMISGQLVFDHADPVQQAYMHLEREPAPLRNLVPEVPAPFDDALLRMLAKRPEQRFASLHQAGQQLLLALN
jgi:serine/threonine protein kinase